MKLLDYYKKMMLYRNIAFYSLVITVFLVGGYLVSAGVLKIGYLMLMYLVIIIMYLRLEYKIFRQPVSVKEKELVATFEKELYVDKIEEYLEYLHFHRGRAKGKRKLYISSFIYYFHNLISEEPYEYFKEILELNKIQVESNLADNNFIYEFEVLRLSREKKYDEVVKIYEKFLDYIKSVYEAGNMEKGQEQYDRLSQSYERMLLVYTNKDKEAFEKSIYTRMNVPAHSKVIGAYLDVLLCQEFGWEDLIPTIQNIIEDVDGDINMLNYVKTA